MGQSPIRSGTTTFVEVIGVAVGSQTLGRLYPRIGPRVMCTIGGFGLTLYLARSCSSTTRPACGWCAA